MASDEPSITCPVCGMTSYHPTDVKTVEVPIFVRGRSVYRRELEIRLTDAVVKRIEQDTPYKITVKARADTRLTGSIDLISQQVLSYNPDTGLARELDVTFNISIIWTDLRTGKERKKVSNLRVTGNYVPEEPLSEDFFRASESAINRAAKLIVEQMEVDW